MDHELVIARGEWGWHGPRTASAATDGVVVLAASHGRESEHSKIPTSVRHCSKAQRFYLPRTGAPASSPALEVGGSKASEDASAPTHGWFWGSKREIPLGRNLTLNPPARTDLTVVCGGRECCTRDYATHRPTSSFHCVEYLARGAGEVKLQQPTHVLKPGVVRRKVNN